MQNVYSPIIAKRLPSIKKAMTDFKESKEEINEELSTDELKCVSGGRRYENSDFPLDLDGDSSLFKC